MIYGTLSADIIQSTSLSIEDTNRLNQYLLDFIQKIKGFNSSQLWGRLVKGDEIEIVTDAPNDILRLAFMLKCYVKSFVPTDAVGLDFKKNGIRISIGVGGLRINNSETGIIDGDAIYISGRNLSQMSNSTKNNLYFSSNITELSDAINTMCVLVGDLLDGATNKQCQVLYLKMLGKNEKDIAVTLGVSQPTVNKISSSASWHSISKVLDFFENVKF